MNAQELYHCIEDEVLGWAVRFADSDAIDSVIGEMMDWTCGSRVRTKYLAIVSVATYKNITEEVVAVSTGKLHVASEKSWFVNPNRKIRSANATVVSQAAVAMLNGDKAMVRAIFDAHEDVGGPAALFAVAVEATGAVASFLNDGMTIDVRQGKLSDWGL